MLESARAIMRDGRIELLEPLPLRDGTAVMVTVLTDEDERQFWLQVSDRALAEVWQNNEDDVYAELLQNLDLSTVGGKDHEL